MVKDRKELLKMKEENKKCVKILMDLKMFLMKEFGNGDNLEKMGYCGKEEWIEGLNLRCGCVEI